jgi:hypothetical protein
MSPDWWTVDTVKDDISAPIIKIMLQVAEIRFEMNNLLLGVYDRTTDGFQKILELIRRLQALEQDYQAWEAALPAWWHPKTIAWVDNAACLDLSKAEVCPGKVETYHNIRVATTWNHARIVRIHIASAIVRCSAWIASPVDYRTIPEYAHSARLSIDLVTDVISSMPYFLGWDISKGGNMGADSSNFAAGLQSFMRPKPIGGFFALFPIFIVSCMDYVTDSQRTWCKGRMIHIASIMGMNHARVLAGVSDKTFSTNQN